MEVIMFMNRYLVILQDNLYIIEADSKESALVKFRECNNRDTISLEDIQAMPKSGLLNEMYACIGKYTSPNGVFVANP